MISVRTAGKILGLGLAVLLGMALCAGLVLFAATAKGAPAAAKPYPRVPGDEDAPLTVGRYTCNVVFK